MKVIWEAADIRGGRSAKYKGGSPARRGVLICYREADRDKVQIDTRWLLVDLADGSVLLSHQTKEDLAEWLTIHDYLPEGLPDDLLRVLAATNSRS